MYTKYKDTGKNAADLFYRWNSAYAGCNFL